MSAPITATERAYAIERSLSSYQNRQVERHIKAARSEEHAIRVARDFLNLGGSYHPGGPWLTWRHDGVYVGTNEDRFSQDRQRRITYAEIVRHVRAASQEALF